jgi:hypothetical protein
MAVSGNTVQDSIIAQDVMLTLVAESGSLGADTRLMSEVTKFDGEWVPDIYKKWPSGAANYHHQLVGGYYKVMMTADQMGGGFLSLAAKQNQALQQGLAIPMVRLTRTATTKSGQTFRETYVRGIITSAKNAQGGGNTPLTTDVTIEFEDMQ